MPQQPGASSDNPSSIRTYVRRQGRFTKAQQRAWQRYAARYILPESRTADNWSAVFGADKPLVVEIGCGYGEATVANAAANGARHYVVFEVHAPGVGALMNRLAQAELENVRIVCADAVSGIESLFADETVRDFNIFFPDPWPKKKHRKRRLLRGEIIEMLRRKLKPEGGIHFATDCSDYAEQVRELCTAAGWRDSPPPPRATTAYERRGVAGGRAIYEFYFIRPVQALTE